jgi:hypothetical protein
VTHHRFQIAIITECFFIDLFYGFIDDDIHDMLRCSTAPVHKEIISYRVIGHFASIIFGAAATSNGGVNHRYNLLVIQLQKSAKAKNGGAHHRDSH